MIRYNSVHMYKVLNFTGNLPNDKDPLKIPFRKKYLPQKIFSLENLQRLRETQISRAGNNRGSV